MNPNLFNSDVTENRWNDASNAYIALRSARAVEYALTHPLLEATCNSVYSQLLAFMEGWELTFSNTFTPLISGVHYDRGSNTVTVRLQSCRAKDLPSSDVFDDIVDILPEARDAAYITDSDYITLIPFTSTILLLQPTKEEFPTIKIQATLSVTCPLSEEEVSTLKAIGVIRKVFHESKWEETVVQCQL